MQKEVPSVDKKGDAAWPQTFAFYLRIKDGNLHVSFVQKYLVKKHNLASESEDHCLGSRGS